MTSTRLLLKNMVFYGYHGVFAAERELGQKIEVDVELYANLVGAGQADNLAQTINYGEVYSLVKRIVEEAQFSLIEAIGAAIVQQIRNAYDVERITVRVRKPQPPVKGLLETVEFEITDSQD